jgi:hypothetical protein
VFRKFYLELLRISSLVRCVMLPPLVWKVLALRVWGRETELDVSGFEDLVCKQFSARANNVSLELEHY